jgi:hypothetical protein
LKKVAELSEKIIEMFGKALGWRAPVAMTYIEKVFEIKKPYYNRGELTEEFINRDSRIIREIAEEVKKIMA